MSATPKAGSQIKREWEQQKRKTLSRIGIGAVVLCALLALGVIPLFSPLSSQRRAVRLVVPERTGVAEIGRLLQEKGVIRSGAAFRLYARWNQQGGNLKSGRYTLSPNMTLAQIMQTLQTGPNGATQDGVRVTIPEGYTLQRIAETLESKGVCDAEAFLKFAKDPTAYAQLKTDFPLPPATLEGYLFPDTYYFAPRTPPKQAIGEMLLNFAVRFYRPYREEIGRSEHSLHELVTIASLVEREARGAEDRARIAGVIENRLQQGKRLEIDATILYALGRHKERVLYEDLKSDSPYNTYRKKGLPPGAIANPGLATLEAALRPERHNYLFYVAMPNAQGDVRHVFTRTLPEHEALVRERKRLLGRH